MTEKEIHEQIVLRLKMINDTKGRESVMCHCPFHTDRTPSCSVNLETGQFYCFSCGRGSHETLRTLYKDLTGHSINKDLGIKWEGHKESGFLNPFQEERAKKDLSLPEVHIALQGSFIPIETSKEAVAYLNKRCIPIEVAQDMKMRYATMAKSYDTRDPKNIKKQVIFSKRVIIPIYENNKLINCEGREVFGEEHFRKELKESGKTEEEIALMRYKKCIYPKGGTTSTLYDYDTLDKEKMLYFVEGLMDLAVLRADPYFDKTNSTTIFGASISDRQLYLLKQFDFTYIVDYDLAGVISAMKLINNLENITPKKTWKIVFPPFKDEGVKDVGDVPVKTGKTVKECRERHWFSTSKNLLSSKNMLKELYDKFTEEKKNESRFRKF